MGNIWSILTHLDSFLDYLQVFLTFLSFAENVWLLCIKTGCMVKITWTHAESLKKR